MRVVSVSKLQNKTKRYQIRLDNGADFVLYAGEVRRLGITEGEDFSDEQYDLLLQDILIPRAKQRALHLLEKQDRTESNLRRKLREGGYPETVIDEAVSYVVSYHYIDDRRFAENYIYFHKDSRSRQRIRQDLLMKGIDKELVDEVMEEGYETDERALIKELLAKKHYDPDTADRKEKARMYRFLATRGFTPGDIMDAVKGCE